MAAEHEDEITQMLRFPWKTWPSIAFKFKVCLVNWAKGVSVPGINFDHFKGEDSGSVIKMIKP